MQKPQLRRSSHIIIVRLDDEPNKALLFHGYTGAIDTVSTEIANYIDRNDVIDIDNFLFAQNTLNALKSRGYFTIKSKEEEEAYVIKMADILHRRKKVFKSFMFVVAYDCNFRCPYCYENNVSERGQNWSGKVFTKAMADKAFDAIQKIAENPQVRNKQITLYGGEPLQSKTKEIVQYIVNKGSKLGYNFEAVSNGYDLNEFMDLLSPDKIASIQITIDGVKSRHDERRFHYKTGKSFDRIISNLHEALKKDVKIAIRINTDWSNFDDLKQLKELFEQEGFLSHKNFLMQSALLVNYDTNLNKDKSRASDTTNEATFMTRKEYNQKHQENGYKYGCQSEVLFRKLYKAMKDNELIQFDSTYCGAQSGMYILDPFGDIYSCWALIGKKEYLLGCYGEDEIRWTEEREKWHNWNIGKSSHCCKCKYSFLCGGGCLNRAIMVNEDFKKGVCDNFADTFCRMANRAYKKWERY